MDDQRHTRRAALMAACAYWVLAVFVLTEQFGSTTSDTRLDLSNAPTQFLRDTFSLWNPRVSLGELQNQAYGYLFPQGPFFSGLIEAGLPGWLVQRLWSLLVLVVAAEGLRRLGRTMGLGPYACVVAGLGYALGPRMVAEIGVRSAEILPAAMLPWALIPIVHAVTGRMRPRSAALLSACAFAFSGGVNGTATAAPAALLVVVVVWAVVRGHLSWRFGTGWAAAMVGVNLWWAISLVQLGAYSPPFFDYVEDARTTTRAAGFANGLRGSSNWVDYILISDQVWWPSGYQVSFDPWVVLGTGALAVVGLIGLMAHRGLFRTPLLIGVALGLTFVCAAHTGTGDGPLARGLQDLLDGSLAPLRNVAKADPILRVPLCLGVAMALTQATAAAARARRTRSVRTLPRRAAGMALGGALALAVGAAALPIASANTRTPGWQEVPGHWQETAAFLDGSEASGAAWVVPGSGFGIQTWGWTMEEPLQVLGEAPWVTRSQVPLTPSATIGMLSALEEYLSTGAGSPYLRSMLRRVGIDRIVLRHDLDPVTSLSTPSNLVALALSRSPGIQRVATFGQLDFGPATEIFEVEDATGDLPDGTPGYQLRDTADSVIVAGSVTDAITVGGAGLVGDDQPVLLAGDGDLADVQGDAFRRRERAFGRVHSAESNVMALDDPYRSDRVLPNYPGPPDLAAVVAEYIGIEGVTASTSAGYADVLGEVRPESAPWGALDGDDSTFWAPAPYVDPEGQWIDVELGDERPVGQVELQQPRGLGLQLADRWRVTAGDTSVEVDSDPATGRSSVDLGGVSADSVRIEVASTDDPGAKVGLTQISIEGVTPERTLRLPDVGLVAQPDFYFSAQPETRACISTLLGPDCDLGRQRASEEAAGLDRTISVPSAGSWDPSGLAVARATASAATLLNPYFAVQVSGSSWLGEDPGVSPRLAQDGDPRTSWIADPRDRQPSLTFDLGVERTLRRIDVGQPAGIAKRPTRAVVTAGDERREVDLDDGFATFEPFTGQVVTVTFSRPTDDYTTIGAAEVSFAPGRVAVPLDGAVRTGAGCGLGPPLVVDGRRYPTRVTGLLGAVVAGGQFAVRLCGPDRAVPMTEGEHRVQLLATPQFQPTDLQLRAVGPRAPVERSRQVEVVEDGDTRRVLSLSDGQEAILSAPQSFNAGWSASIDGRVLDPIEVDGWAQGWVVPAGVSGDVVLTFEPQRPYLVGLIGGLVLLALILLAGAAVAVRTRLSPARVDPTAAPRAARGPSRGWTASWTAQSWTARLLGATAAVGAGFVVGGAAVAVGAAVGVVLSPRPAWSRVVAALTLSASTVLVLLELDERTFPPDAADLLTGGGVAVVLAAAALAPCWRADARSGRKSSRAPVSGAVG